MQETRVRARPERLAWLVLWSAFAVFCLLVVFVPLGVRHVLLYSTRARPATLQTLEGTVLVENQATGGLDAVAKDRMAQVGEDSVLTLDEKSEADLRFFDGSYVHIRPGSLLWLERVQAPRFGPGVRPNTIWLRMLKGRVRIVTIGPQRPTGLDFVLRLPHLGATVFIKGEGLFGAEVTPEGAEIFAAEGSAVVTARGRSVQLIRYERTTIEPGSPPTAPIADARDLVTNGSFTRPLTEGWTVSNLQGNDEGTVDGHAVWTTDEGKPAVRFYRTDSQDNHCTTRIEQAIDRDLPDPISSLSVRAEVKLIKQSLSGGGTMGSEYPLMIRLKYRDRYGSENEWIQAFYYENPRNYPAALGKRIPQGTWQVFESGNLLEELKPTPMRIVSLRVEASGWDYESVIRHIGLLVR